MRGIPAVLIDNSARMPSTPSAESDDATHHRQRHAFGQQLPDDASAAGADCGSQRDFTLAGRRPHEQQVRDVGAGNQQHEGRRRR